MTIDKIDVNVCSPGPNFVTLKIVTSDGRDPDGATPHSTRPRTLRRRLPIRAPGIESAATKTASRTPGSTCTEAPTGGAAQSPWPPSPLSTWRCGTSKPKGPVCRSTSGSAARAATAFGSRSRLRPRLRRPDISGYIETHAVPVQTGVPGTRRNLRCRHQRGPTTNPPTAPPTERATAPIEEVWDTRAYLLHSAGDFFSRIREDFGTGVRVLHDGHPTPIGSPIRQRH